MTYAKLSALIKCLLGIVVLASLPPYQPASWEYAWQPDVVARSTWQAAPVEVAERTLWRAAISQPPLR